MRAVSLPSTVLADLAARINAEAATVLGAFRQGLSHAIACGELLIQVYDQLGTGERHRWLAENCPGLTPRVVQMYVRLARHKACLDVDRDAKRISHLTISEALRRISIGGGAGKGSPEKSAIGATIMAQQRFASVILSLCNSPADVERILEAGEPAKFRLARDVLETAMRSRIIEGSAEVVPFVSKPSLPAPDATPSSASAIG